MCGRDAPWSALGWLPAIGYRWRDCGGSTSDGVRVRVSAFRCAHHRRRRSAMTVVNRTAISAGAGRRGAPDAAGPPPAAFQSAGSVVGVLVRLSGAAARPDALGALPQRFGGIGGWDQRCGRQDGLLVHPRGVSHAGWQGPRRSFGRTGRGMRGTAYRMAGAANRSVSEGRLGPGYGVRRGDLFCCAACPTEGHRLA